MSDPVTADIAHLDTQLGGAGFTRIADIHAACYIASSTLAHTGKGPRQRDLKLDLMLAVRNNLLRIPAIKIHLDECSEKGTANWFRKLKDMPTITYEAARAGLRIRLNAVHRQLAHLDTIVCPGCEIELDRHETISHYRGCARIEGSNASQAHAGFKTGVGRVCAKRSIPHETREPINTAAKQCGSCRIWLPTTMVEQHLADSPSCDASALKAQKEVRPDKAIHFADGTVITDESLVATACRTQTRRVAVSGAHLRALADRTKKKVAMYDEIVSGWGDKFLVVCATPNGSLGDHTWQLMRRILANSPLLGDSLQRIAGELRTYIIAQSARALINAERATQMILHDTQQRRLATLNATSALTASQQEGRRAITAERVADLARLALFRDALPAAVAQKEERFADALREDIHPEQLRFLVGLHALGHVTLHTTRAVEILCRRETERQEHEEHHLLSCIGSPFTALLKHSQAAWRQVMPDHWADLRAEPHIRQLTEETQHHNRVLIEHFRTTFIDWLRGLEADVTYEPLRRHLAPRDPPRLSRILALAKSAHRILLPAPSPAHPARPSAAPVAELEQQTRRRENLHHTDVFVLGPTPSPDDMRDGIARALRDSPQFPASRGGNTTQLK